MFCEEDFTNSDLGFEIGLHIKNPPDFAAIARACSAFGQTVEDPSDLPTALKSAIRAVQDGAPAVLDVKIGV
jgi:thiamine pyrophosphate-dependent acetolactate synthase large subunit-like protein